MTTEEILDTTIQRERYLDDLEAWLEDFGRQPGSGLVPEWLEALRQRRQLTAPVITNG